MLATLLIVVCPAGLRVIAEEHRTAIQIYSSSAISAPRVISNRYQCDWTAFAKLDFLTPIEMPRRSRVTRSYRPLRQVTLIGGDRFVAECVDWGADSATFRLLSQQMIHVPIEAVAALDNPTGEEELIDESFEVDSLIKPRPELTDLLDATQSADGDRSLRIIPSSSGYRREFPRSLTSARIEFSFQIVDDDPTSPSGEWHLQGEERDDSQSSIVVRVGSHRRISVAGLRSTSDATNQSWALSAGWHSFIALISAERTRLIVDDAILASFVAPKLSVRAIHFRPAETISKNFFRIDGLQVRHLVSVEHDDPVNHIHCESDSIRFNSRDEVFGHLVGLTGSSVLIEAFGEWQPFPWSRISGLAWKQPLKAVQQSSRPETGIVSIIEMQPFDDRPQCEPEHWSVTVVRVDSEHLIAQHSLVGELVIEWSQIRRITPLFLGRTMLVDGRRFHLGNSIRTDFHRMIPDGTEWQVNLKLPEIPRGQTFLALDVAELEAAAPNAPPGSPFLEDLRAGRLVTDVVVNEQPIGNLNSLLRFKATVQHPDRIRLPIPLGILKTSDNSIRLTQKPLKATGGEFDDCEVSNIRFEFDRKE